jgi:hypothetical protein
MKKKKKKTEGKGSSHERLIFFHVIKNYSLYREFILLSHIKIEFMNNFYVEIEIYVRKVSTNISNNSSNFFSRIVVTL